MKDTLVQDRRGDKNPAVDSVYMRRNRMYRVENALHAGPYTAYEGDKDASMPLINFSPSSCPGPSEDGRMANAWARLGERGMQEEYIFGFTSLTSLYAWFGLPEQVAWLTAHGFQIVSYRLVGPALIGHRQIAVRRDDVIFSGVLTHEEGGF